MQSQSFEQSNRERVCRSREVWRFFLSFRIYAVWRSFAHGKGVKVEGKLLTVRDVLPGKYRDDTLLSTPGTNCIGPDSRHRAEVSNSTTDQITEFPHRFLVAGDREVAQSCEPGA
jgi:hypothetical protein